MASTHLETHTFASPKAEMWRVAASFLLILLAFQFQWQFLCDLTTRTLISASHFFGVNAIRDSGSTFSINHLLFKVAMPCTNIEAILGTLPLLWDGRYSIKRNVRNFVIFALAIQAVNLLRLVLGFVAYSHGFSWLFSHEIPAGIFYFLWVVWIIRHSPVRRDYPR